MELQITTYAKMFMKKCNFLFVFFVLLRSLTITAQEASIFKPINTNDPKGRKLPPGVPRTIDTNGNVIYIDVNFTTPQYRQAAIKLILQEANLVAKELQLPERLPITETNLTEAAITPFGFNYKHKGIGSVGTSNYVYYVTKNNKFNEVDIANYDQACSALKKQLLPIEEIDTNSAYQLAIQWLGAVSMDVNELNRDCTAHVTVSPFWNRLTMPGQKPTGKVFVPIYYVWWTPRNEADKFGGADVELFLPTKQLLQLCVREPKYILRKPVIFTNLDELFPGTAPITVFTNFPVNAKPTNHVQSL